MITCNVPSTNLINFDHMTASKLLLPSGNANTVQIALVGCGGTGSWLAPHLARLAKLLNDQNKAVDLVFIDPDAVEEKNCYRQNFCFAEIGQNKAETLAHRYGFAWGVEIRALAVPFSAAAIATSEYMGTRLIIGCVDNAKARKSILDVVEHAPYWWLDCGNHHDAGQVLLGSGLARNADAFRLPGFCGWLPMPSLQHPELMQDEVALEDIAPALSCADAALAGAQGLTVNATVAAIAADYLYRMLITKDLEKFATYVDLAAGSMRSRYITSAEVIS